MTHQNLYTVFQERFPTDPEAVFLDADRRTLRYSDVDAESGRFLAVLTSCGVVPGDRVFMQVEKSIEAVLLYLACLRAGAVFVPLNTGYTGSEIEYFLSDTRPALFVCRPEDEETVTLLAHKAGVEMVLSLGAESDGSLMEAVREAQPLTSVEPCTTDDLAAILYTSGTTGRSKGAMLTHDNLLSNGLVLHEYWQWVEGDVLLHTLPIFHVHGLFVALHCALLNGSRIIFLDKFDVDRVVEELPKSTVLMGGPTFYVRLLEADGFDRDLCATMRLFISGSAPLLAETFTTFEARTGQPILERYGMTEAGMITSNPYSGSRVPGTVGFALPGVTARVADDKGREIERGEVGVLEVRGPNVFAGYWEMPEKTAEEFRADGFFITGDLATMDPEGRITIVGRAKDLVISGGYNVYPKEVEEQLDLMPGIKESCVIGVPNKDLGEAVAAIVVLDGTAEVSLNTAQTFLVQKLAKFKQPKSLIIVDELPRNTMGKVQKKQLRERYRNAG